MMTKFDEKLMRWVFKREAHNQKILITADLLITYILKKVDKGEKASIKFMFENELFEMWCDACGLSADTLRYAVKKMKG